MSCVCLPGPEGKSSLVICTPRKKGCEGGRGMAYKNTDLFSEPLGETEKSLLGPVGCVGFCLFMCVCALKSPFQPLRKNVGF